MPDCLLVVLVIIAVASGLWLLNRFLLWMESRGWIYWTRSNNESISTGVGNALFEVQTMLEPDKKAIQEVMREEYVDETEEGAPQDPDRDSGDDTGENPH
jgi:hypothetical protein